MKPRFAFISPAATTPADHESAGLTSIRTIQRRSFILAKIRSCPWAIAAPLMTTE